MRWLLTLGLLLWPLLTLAATIRFEGDLLGKAPAGWTIALTHAGTAPRWEIVRDETAPHPPYVPAQLPRDTTVSPL